MGRKNHEGNVLNPFERALDIIQRLQAGQRLSVNKIADIYGVHKRSGYRIYNEASRILHIYASAGELILIDGSKDPERNVVYQPPKRKK